jgi:hypothetical protein
MSHPWGTVCQVQSLARTSNTLRSRLIEVSDSHQVSREFYVQTVIGIVVFLTGAVDCWVEVRQ